MEQEIECHQTSGGVEFNFDSLDVGEIFDKLIECEALPDQLKA